MQPKNKFPSRATVDEALQHAQHMIGTVSESPTLDSQVLLFKVMNKNRTWVIAHPKSKLSGEEENQYQQVLVRRSQGEPLPYILGSWEFFGRRFHVDPSVLIPRAETEHLVEEVLTFLDANRHARKVLELGTGSGCIAISLLLESRNIHVVATDISLQALRTAAKNIREYDIGDRIDLVQMDLFSGIRGQFDIVCANLPYIPSATLVDLPVGRWEPRVALDGGENGFKHIRQFITGVAQVLGPEGKAILEIEENQADEIRSMIRSVFPESSVRIGKDLAGFDRIVVFER